MHKITKGLKKKKKGKKSKRNEDELFKPEELENYRKEHQGANEEAGPQNEEWKKFIALTHGVDDVLKKTQGDLDRIKSTSFFQRKPTESEVKRVEEQKVEEQKRVEVQQEEKAAVQVDPIHLGIVEVSESESEEEADDNIFDTAYVDVLASGEVKLAYIPESPTEKQEGDDPFDTSIAERAILGPEILRKGKKLVPLGAAVEVLTGRVQLPTCATKKSDSRRQIPKERDLLLGSFDDTANLGVVATEAQPEEEIKKTLLDEDPELPIDVPIDLSRPIQIPQQTRSDQIINNKCDKKDIIDEFDVITKDDDEDIEFELLAAESLSKSSTKAPIQHTSAPIVTADIVPENCKWSAFDTEVTEERSPVINDDPFDTTFAENIFPDLKSENAGTLVKEAYSSTQIDAILFESDSRIPVDELNAINPTDRDLLGGSNLDLTSITKTDLLYSNTDNIEDDDFDPRADEPYRERTVSRPDVLNISTVKTVSFDIPSPEGDLLGADTHKVIKPLTPFYSRKCAVPESELSDKSEINDPFDTTFVANLAPGKAELKVIESELLDPNAQRNLEDNNFDPRDEQKAKIDKVVDTIKDISSSTLTTVTKSVDLLAIDNDIHVKVLTPGGATEDTGEILYKDPFDTSIACNIQPGKTELKLLENELIYSDKNNHPNLDISVIKNSGVDDLLLQKQDIIIEKPLSPSEQQANSAIVEEEFNPDFDPFDTSSVDNIQPGKVELKLLESEFIQ